MYNGIVLNIDFIAHLDKVHIPSHYSIKPDAAIISHAYLTYNGGVGCNKGIVAKFGRKTPNRKNERHIFS
jgi:hypothetical protein